MKMATTRQHDHLNRLGSIVSTPTSSAAIGNAFRYSATHLRGRVSLADLSAGQARQLLAL